jgi:hypothetical protein
MTPTNYQGTQKSGTYNAQTIFDPAALPADVVKAFMDVQMQLSNNIKCNDFISAMPLPKKNAIVEDVDLLETKLTTIRGNIIQYSNLADEVKEKVQGAFRNAEIVFSIYRELSSSKSTRSWSQDSPCQIMWDLLKDCDHNISHIRVMIDYLEQSLGATVQPFNQQSLKNILMDEQHLLLAATSQVQSINDLVENLKQKYVQFRSHYYNDNSDPFKELSKDESDQPLFKPKKLATHLQIEKTQQAQQQPQTNPGTFGGFGTTSSNTAFSFGATSATSSATTSFSFGAQNKPATTGFSFGPAATTPVLASTFGSPSTTSTTTPSFSFSTTTNTTTQSSTTTFSFGAPTATPSNSGNTFTFGKK